MPSSLPITVSWPSTLWGWIAAVSGIITIVSAAWGVLRLAKKKKALEAEADRYKEEIKQFEQRFRELANLAQGIGVALEACLTCREYSANVAEKKFDAARNGLGRLRNWLQDLSHEKHYSFRLFSRSEWQLMWTSLNQIQSDLLVLRSNSKINQIGRCSYAINALGDRFRTLHNDMKDAVTQNEY